MIQTFTQAPDRAAEGTSLRGYCPLGTTYLQLAALFGEPDGPLGGKVDARWVVRFTDGTIAAVYNYKTGRAYLGSAGRDRQDLCGHDWHIGGMTQHAVDLVHAALAALEGA